MTVERIHTGDLGVVCFVVAVVARTHEEEIAAHLLLQSARINGKQPLRVSARPIRSDNPMGKANLLLQPILINGFVEVLHNRGAISNRLLRVPRLKRKA